MWRIYPSESPFDLYTTSLPSRRHAECLVHHDLTNPRTPSNHVMKIVMNVVRPPYPLPNSPRGLLPSHLRSYVLH